MTTCASAPPDPLLEALGKHWGFTEFRPLQREAVEAALGGRDALVVLPTGGGKSCATSCRRSAAGRSCSSSRR